MESKSLDVLFTNSPLAPKNIAPAAPAILIAMLEKYGYTGHFYDFNIDLEETPSVHIFAHKGIINDSSYIDNLLKKHTRRMLNYNPKYIGISIFSRQCLNFAKAMCMYIRGFAPNVKIILGGQGLSDTINLDSLGSDLEKLNLCDYWVKSEGEYPIIDILKGSYKNTNNWIQSENLDDFPFPNYSSYDWSKYKKIIPITGSRGCVRRCTFCDIHSHWKKFVWRSGPKITEEMVHQSKKHNINEFEFTDSLVNGSMKSYVDFITTLAEYNNNNEKLKWRGQFIIRPKRQMSENIWKLTAESGCEEIYIGIESGSESVRNHMRKKFSNDDIEFSLKCMKKYGIKCIFLIIVGYVTETQETIQETMDMFTRFKEYANNTIHEVSFGHTLSILPGTPLFDGIAKKEGVQGINQLWNWIGLSNFMQRTKWREEMVNHCSKLGYCIYREDELEQYLHNKKDLINNIE